MYLLLLSMAVLAKVLGCAIPSLFCGFNVLGALRVGAGMIPRGEVALIIAGIGLSNGYLTQEVFGIGILMTLATTVVAPPCLVGLFGIRARGMRHRRPRVPGGARPFSFHLASDRIARLALDELMRAFRHEGFYTYLLNSRANIWSVAVDKTEISVRRDGARIRFECTPDAEESVMKAWMEVVDELRDIAKSIENPVRSDDLEEFYRIVQKNAQKTSSIQG